MTEAAENGDLGSRTPQWLPRVLLGSPYNLILFRGTEVPPSSSQHPHLSQDLRSLPAFLPLDSLPLLLPRKSPRLWVGLVPASLRTSPGSGWKCPEWICCLQMEVDTEDFTSLVIVAYKSSGVLLASPGSCCLVTPSFPFFSNRTLGFFWTFIFTLSCQPKPMKGYWGLLPDWSLLLKYHLFCGHHSRIWKWTFFSCYNSTKVKAQEQMFGLINAERKFPETKQDYMTTALYFSTHPGQRADQHGSALLCLRAAMHGNGISTRLRCVALLYKRALISPTYRLTLVVPEEQHEDSPRKYWTPILLERMAGSFLTTDTDRGIVKSPWKGWLILKSLRPKGPPYSPELGWSTRQENACLENMGTRLWSPRCKLT